MIDIEGVVGRERERVRGRIFVAIFAHQLISI
jgi:hypothetical protein